VHVITADTFGKALVRRWAQAASRASVMAAMTG